jgi:DNA repair exonuclease SbcCD ATPase subunit
MPVEIFDGHHIALLGDIHKKQDLQHFDDLNQKPAVSYPGSMIQQNHGESLENHGFSVWDLKTKTYKFYELKNDYGFFKVEVKDGKIVTDLKLLPKKARVKVEHQNSKTTDVKAAIEKIKLKCEPVELNCVEDSVQDQSSPAATTNYKLANFDDVSYQNVLLTDYLNTKCELSDKSIVDSVISINEKLNKQVVKDKFAKNVKWIPKKFEFDNMFSFGEGNVVDFSKTKGVIGLFAPNRTGKSSLFSALCFCLFEKFDRGYKAVNVLNVDKKSFRCKFNFEIAGVDFFIEKTGTMDKKGAVSVVVEFWKIVDGKKISLNGEARRNTNDFISEYIGSYEDFILTALSVQSGKNVNSFVDMDQSLRKDLLSQFIGLNIYDQLSDLAKSESKEVSVLLKNYKKDELESGITSNRSEKELFQKSLNDETRQLDEIKANRNDIQTKLLAESSKIRQVSTKVINVNDARNKLLEGTKLLKTTETLLKTNQLELESITAGIMECNKKVDKFAKDGVEKKYSEYQSLNTELAHINGVIELKKVTVGNKMKKLDLLKQHKYDPNCKYCVNSVFVKDATQTTNELEKEKTEVSSIIQDKADKKKRLDDLEWTKSAYQEYSLVLQESNKLKSVESRLFSSILENNSTIDKINKKLQELQTDIRLYEADVENIDYNRKIQNDICDIQLNLRNIDFSIDQRSKKIMELSSRIAILSDKIDQSQKTIEKVKSLEVQNEAYQHYIKSVSRDGIPYVIISQTCPKIETEVNNILGSIVDFSIKMETDGKNISPILVYNGRRWPVEMGSGFEKFVASVAIRIALISISMIPRPNFLCIDEGFGVIDSVNMPSIQSLFDFMNTKFDFVIIISHLDALRDMVETRMEMKKDDQFSTVRFE